MNKERNEKENFGKVIVFGRRRKSFSRLYYLAGMRGNSLEMALFTRILIE